MKSLSYALLVLPLVAAAVRAQDKIPESPYVPLAVGNTWHYRAGENKFDLRVAKHEKVGNVMTARIEMVVNGEVKSAENVGITDQGLCRFSFEGKKAAKPILYFKLPPKAGEKWTVDTKLDSETLKGTFTEGEKEVKVPAGAFQTFSSSSTDFNANGTKMSITYYFAKDTGMVKEEIEVGGEKIVIELEKFDAAKK